MIDWEETKYGHKLTSNKLDKEYASLEQNTENGEYYFIGCGSKIWLDAENLEHAKRATMDWIITDLEYEKANIDQQIREIEHLMCCGKPLPEED